MTCYNNNRQKIKAMLLLCLLLFSTPSAAAKIEYSQSLVIGLIDYPPHLDFKKAMNQSKLYQYITQTFANKGFELTFRQFPSKRGKKELQAGNIDLLLPFDDEVNESIKLLTKPLFHSIPGLCFKKKSSFQF